MAGPLTGLRVLEFAGLGPGPHAAMVLADLGADVLSVNRSADDVDDADFLLRGRTTTVLDLKSDAGREQALRLAGAADVLIDPFRPGVLERLGLGPENCLTANPRLVYARMTGWGQDGPLAPRAGHDINYIALTGVLNAIGHAGERPVPPMNLVGDFGGGSMFLLTGILAALWERERSGAGQVVDAAMVDGISVLSQMIWSFRAAGRWSDQRGTNPLDSGAPYYDTYECADGRYVAVGAVEPRFFAELLDGLGLSAADLPAQRDRDGWPKLRACLAAAFRTRGRDEWTAHFAGRDACVTGVLSFAEALAEPHLATRNTFVRVGDNVEPAPAPRFSRTVPGVPRPPVHIPAGEAAGRWEVAVG